MALAIEAGCSVVIKPPGETTYTCLTLMKLSLRSGMSSRIIQVRPTITREAALNLATRVEIRKLRFTGLTGVGRVLAKLAAGTLKKVGLNVKLGGNVPSIVSDHADLNSVASAAIFRNSRFLARLVPGRLFFVFILVCSLNCWVD